MLEFLERQGEGASSDIAAKLGLSMARTRVLLKRYVNEGIIGMKGEKKGIIKYGRMVSRWQVTT